jgi:hypothetical protein
LLATRREIADKQEAKTKQYNDIPKRITPEALARRGAGYVDQWGKRARPNISNK